MTKPVRIQRKRTKGWKMPPNTVSVTRPGKWGNFYRVGECMCKTTLWRWGYRSFHKRRLLYVCNTPSEAVERFKAEINDPIDRVFWPEKRHQIINELRGKNLACFCPLDQPCHADVLLEIANA